MSGKKLPYLSWSKLKKIDAKQFWRDCKEAIAGTERDFTKTSPGKAIMILAIPMVLEMAMESVFAIVDIFFVSKLGTNAVATVGITESVMTIVYALGAGLSVATTALVSRRIGEKKKKEASLVAFQAIMAGFIVSLVISVPGIVYAKPFLRIMGATEQMIQEYFWYPALMFGGNMVIMLLFIINAVFRSSGDAAISMRIMWIANIINMILDPLLIFGLGPFPELGIMGAALATNIGRALAVLYQFVILFSGKHRIRLYLSSIKLKIQVMVKLLKVSAGGIMQNLIATASWILLVRIISSSGPDALAGYTIAIRIILFILLPASGLSNAASTLVGQNLGAGQPDKAEKAVWLAGYINMILMGIVGLILVLAPEPAIRLFIDTPEVVSNGVKCLRIISYGFILYGLGMAMFQGFNGSGDTITPTIANFFCFWIIEIPLAYFLSITLDMGITGASIAIVIAESLLALTGLVLFKRGKWKLRKV